MKYHASKCCVLLYALVNEARVVMKLAAISYTATAMPPAETETHSDELKLDAIDQ